EQDEHHPVAARAAGADELHPRGGREASALYAREQGQQASRLPLIGRRACASTAAARFHGVAELAPRAHDALTRGRERFHLVHDALADAVGVVALGFDVARAGIGNLLHAIERPLQTARHAVEGPLAAAAELIVMRLHAEQHAALAAGHIAAELVDVVAAGFLDALNRVRDTFTNLGLRRDAGGRPYHCQQG